MQIKPSLDLRRIGVLFLYMSVTLEIILVIVDKSNYTNPIEGQLFRITFLLAVVKILFTRYTGRQWLALILFGLLGFVSYKATGRNEIIRIVTFVAACSNVDVKRLLKYVFYLTLSGCMVLVILSVTGIYGGLYLETDFGRGYTQIRYCLGLGHPNALHGMFLMLVLLGLYLYNVKMKWYCYFILFLMNYGLYVLTDSNTGMLLTFCGIAGAAVVRYWNGLENAKWMYIACAGVFLFCAVLSVLLAYPGFTKPSNFGFDNPFVWRLESFLNGRIIDLYYGSVNSEGTIATWSLFSGPENSYYFDMGFVRVFYWYGIIPGLVYVALHVLMIVSFYRKKDSMGVVMTVVLAVYTVVEAHIISVYIGRNYQLFLLGMYISGMLYLDKGQEFYLWNCRPRRRYLSETEK